MNGFCKLTIIIGISQSKYIKTPFLLSDWLKENMAAIFSYKAEIQYLITIRRFHAISVVMRIKQD